MGASFPHPVKLINVKMQDNALNPWETHDFLYPHFAIPDPMTCIISYLLSGDVPKGISVDSSGNIKGKIEHFGKQPSCQDNKPNEKTEFDGSNMEKNGRFKKLYYDFHFTIQVKWVEKKDTPNGPVPCTVPGSTTEECIIRMVKNHNIDNQIWMEKYLDDGKSGGNSDTGEIKPSINIDGEVISDSSSGTSKSPGPFLKVK